MPDRNGEPQVWDKADEIALYALQHGVRLLPWQVTFMRHVFNESEQF